MTKNDRIAQITLPYVALPSYRDDCPRFCEMFKALPLSVVRDMTNKVGLKVEFPRGHSKSLQAVCIVFSSKFGSMKSRVARSHTT